MVPNEELRRHKNIMFTHENLKCAIPHRQYRTESKKFITVFLGVKPRSFRG